MKKNLAFVEHKSGKNFFKLTFIKQILNKSFFDSKTMFPYVLARVWTKINKEADLTFSS